MDRAHEDDKNIALAKAHDLYAVVPPKKNRKFYLVIRKQPYKQ